jgi:N-carbamoyl-L-amino-acid hydrolase
MVPTREGSRFESGCTGSAVWSAYISLEQGHAIKTIGEDSTLHSELRRIGYQGSSLADYKSNKLSGHFELRIEQGSRLERAALNIGVVNGIQGNRRLQVLVQGEKAHAGLTPMNERVDALVASSKIVLSVEAAGVRYGGFATVGVLHCEHGSINSVPGETFFTIDLRHPSSKSLDLMEACIRTDMERLESSNQRLRVKVDLVWESPAVRFDEIAVQCVRKSAQERFGVSAVAELDSFAGHDSAFTQLRVPTAMIFVPSRDGISHAPEEYTSESQWWVMRLDQIYELG